MGIKLSTLPWNWSLLWHTSFVQADQRSGDQVMHEWPYRGVPPRQLTTLGELLKLLKQSSTLPGGGGAVVGCGAAGAAGAGGGDISASPE